MSSTRVDLEKLPEAESLNKALVSRRLLATSWSAPPRARETVVAVHRRSAGERPTTPSPPIPRHQAPAVPHASEISEK
jgi:hypothetical protein